MSRSDEHGAGKTRASPWRNGAFQMRAEIWNGAMRNLLRLGIVGLLAMLTAGCSSRPEARLGGDAGGSPVTVVVNYDSQALSAMTANGHFQRTVVVDRNGFGSGFGAGFAGEPFPRHHHHYGYGAGAGWYGPPMVYEPNTSVSILVGRGPAEAQYLRARLVGGTWDWTLPIIPGTEVVVSLQAQGGRSGWYEIGRFTSTAGQTVRIELSGAEPRLTVDELSDRESEAVPPEQAASPSDSINATPSSEKTPAVSE